MLDDETIEKLSKVDKEIKSLMLLFHFFFIDEILEKLRAGINYQDSLTQLGYFRKYLDITPYDYLPPLNPSQDDIKWLKKNVKNFNVEHLFYQPLVSPNVKRVISILRKLVNDLIKRYGKIDQIIIGNSKRIKYKNRRRTNQKNLKQIVKKR